MKSSVKLASLEIYWDVRARLKIINQSALQQAHTSSHKVSLSHLEFQNVRPGGHLIIIGSTYVHVWQQQPKCIIIN